MPLAFLPLSPLPLFLPVGERMLTPGSARAALDEGEAEAQLRGHLGTQPVPSPYTV